MAQVTLAQLRTDVLRCADMVSSSFVPQDELDRHINKSGGELWGLLASKYEDYLTQLSPTSVTVGSGQSSFSLTGSADFFKLRGVDRQEGSGWVQLQRFSLEQRERLNATTYPWAASYIANAIRYDTVGNDVYLLPEAQAPGTYRYRYVAAWTNLVNASDSINVPNGWEEYIVVDAAIKCMMKEETDVSMLLVRKSALKSRIESEATNRDASEQEFVTLGTNSGWGWGWGGSW